MTVIKPNSVAGINSITVQSGNSLAVHKANGELIRTITSNSGVSTFSSISVGTAATTNSAGKSINIGVGASISQHDGNTLSLGTGGDERLRIYSGGQVSIRNTNATSFNTGGDDLVIGSGTDTADAGITLYSHSSDNCSIFFNDTADTGITGLIQYRHDVDCLRFFTATSERLRIDSSGRIGVGVVPTAQFAHNLIQIGHQATLGANAALSATGQTFLTHNLYFDTGGTLKVFNTSNANEGAIFRLIDGQLLFSNSAATTGTPTVTERLRIDSSGRVLIGVNASYANASIDELQIGDNSSSNQSGITIGSTDESAIAFADAGDTRAGSMTYNHAADAMIFKTNGQNEYFRVHTNGVKVNSASDAIMEMHTSNGTAHSRINFSNNNGDNTGGIWYSSSNHMQFRTASDYQFVISATNGRLERSFGAGSSTDADGMWFNNDQSATGTFVRFWQTSGSYGANQIGTISHTANNTAYNTSSDYRLKENAVAISDGITRLKTLKPYRFNFKTEPSKTVDGFFAHEAATVVPEAVTGTKDEVSTIADTSIGVAVGDPVHQGMDYGKITPLLTAALQEAIAKIEVLETKVAALEGG